MARRRYARRRHGGGRRKGIRIAATIGLAVGAYALAKGIMGARSGGAMAMADVACGGISGYSFQRNDFDYKRMVFTIPVAVGCGVSMVGAKVGLNKYMPKHIKL